MGQSAETGRAANDYGYRCARAVAKHLGAQLLGETSNQVILSDGDHAVIKSAHHGTPQIGVSLHMLDEVKWIIAALENESSGSPALGPAGNSHSLHKLSVVWYRARMTPSRSKSSASARKTRMVETRDVKRLTKRFDVMPAGWEV